MQSVLELNQVSKSYKGFKLDKVSFSLPRGYIMGFIGPNGSGKTTTLRLIMNLVKMDAGAIQVFGLDHVKSESEIKQRIGFIHDEPVFYEQLSVRRMTSIIRPFYRQWDQKKYEEYLHRFDLDETKRIRELSKGMRTKYSLALALSHGAELLIMDEPTAGLDPVFRRELLDILLDVIQKEENSILFSSHITSDLDRVADFITFIKDGSIVFSEEKDAVFDRLTLVKGGREDLSDEIRSRLIGYSLYGTRFEGLSDERTLGEHLIYETPSLEDIMFFHTKGQVHDH